MSRRCCFRKTSDPMINMAPNVSVSRNVRTEVGIAWSKAEIHANTGNEKTDSMPKRAAHSPRGKDFTERACSGGIFKASIPGRLIHAMDATNGTSYRLPV